MAGCNARVTAPTISGATCTVTIELRADAADVDAAYSFPFTFPITDGLADVKRRAKDRIVEAWSVYLAESARKARAATVLAAVDGQSFNVNW